MRKLRTILSVLACICALQASAAVQTVGDPEFNGIIQNGVTIVDLYADWCGPCKNVAPLFERLSAGYEGKVKFIKVNIDKSPQVTRMYNVSSIPTFLIFKDGKLVNQKVGVFDEAGFKTFIEGAVSKK